MSSVTRVVILLVFYAALFVLMRIGKKGVEANEKRTFAVLALVWSVSMFIANYLGYVFGVMSFLPWWPNNFLHTFVWIGGGLSYLYLAVRRE